MRLIIWWVKALYYRLFYQLTFPYYQPMSAQSPLYVDVNQNPRLLYILTKEE